MAKTLVEFEGHPIDVMTIFNVYKTEEWNETEERIEFCIILNKDLPEKYLIRDWYFKFASSELRDKKMKRLINKVSQLEHINIL